MMQARVLSMIERGGTPTIKQEEEYEDDYMEEQKPNNVVVLTTGSSKVEIYLIRVYYFCVRLISFWEILNFTIFDLYRC